MRKTLIAATLIVLAPAIAFAHVTVRPRESKAGTEERYTVRVPTEGTVATVSVELEIPDGVTVIDVEKAEDVTFETRKEGDRVVRIVWTKTIAPKEAGEFVFRARNPESGTEIVWKAHQHFADGTVTDWSGPAGYRRPASMTKLVSAP